MTKIQELLNEEQKRNYIVRTFAIITLISEKLNLNLHFNISSYKFFAFSGHYR